MTMVGSSCANQAKCDIELDLSHHDIPNIAPCLNEFPSKSQTVSTEPRSNKHCPLVAAVSIISSRNFQVSAFTLLIIGTLVVCALSGRTYIRALLKWLESVQPWYLGPCIFSLLFLPVSLPICWGFTPLLLTGGYLYGCWLGVVVCMGASCSAILASHTFMKKCCHHRISHYMEGFKMSTMLSLLNHDMGFKIVMLSRLTPLPFGVQNAFFSLSNMALCRYVACSLIGLFPMITVNCYIGSTLRSVEDAWSQSSQSVLPYFIISSQLLLSSCLLFCVTRIARTQIGKVINETSLNSTTNKDSMTKMFLI